MKTSTSGVFFFQAEDGIRDYKVTGVQTCALPIYSRCIRRPSSASNALTLIDRLAEFSVCRETVFEITAYGTCFDGQTDGFGGGFRRVTIAAFQIDRHRQGRRLDDPAQIFDGQCWRYLLAVGEAVCIGDRPTARGDRFRTSGGDGLGAA